MNTIWKSSLLGLIIFSLSMSAKAQSRWTLSATVAPLYGYSAIKNDVGLGSLYPIIISSQGSSVGYRLGIMGHFTLSAHWSFSTGLWMNYQRANAPSVQAPITVDYVSYPYHRRTYQLPLLVNYRLLNRRLSPYFSVGVLANFRSKTYFETGNQQEFALKLGEKDVTFQPTVGAGVSYQLSNHIALTGQPMISVILPEQHYLSYLAYTLSFQTQLVYSF